MGLLVDGKWQDQWYDTKSNDGKFVRKESSFRNYVTSDGSAGPTGEAGFKAEKDRYHLYVSLACPWAHRTLIFRKLKKLEEIIPVSTVDYLMKENGWEFDAQNPKLVDQLNGFNFLHQVYTKAAPDYTGRVTVPILWDKKKQTIVNNESSEIIRMFNSAFDEVGAAAGDYYPQALRAEIDELNKRIYSEINNGVYKAGFATTQSAYEENVIQLFQSLDWLERLLSNKRYLTGDQITEADWRLFTTLVRFDPVYVGHFKCNIRRLADSPNLFGYVRDLYQQPGVAETVNMEHIKKHYYMSHTTINPTAVVPVGPEIDYLAPHGRA
ncbi:glutathione S-transferase family protein [Aliikangiella coralliicola]|uniref:Glutathione S-transferase family protein n=1 Tax=Aliikangiella coralliicola TaxID=2592383 RepID=A0A545UIS9_9GAMM|nr:glutathione S-transferase family protein [Aliikangiella coralliicola]TQV89369.1 glutathione S-transferase family protein [Aliikangiella coralliicola]